MITVHQKTLHAPVIDPGSFVSINMESWKYRGEIYLDRTFRHGESWEAGATALDSRICLSFPESIPPCTLVMQQLSSLGKAETSVLEDLVSISEFTSSALPKSSR